MRILYHIVLDIKYKMITGPVQVIIFVIIPSKYFVLRKNIYTFAIKLINHP